LDSSNRNLKVLDKPGSEARVGNSDCGSWDLNHHDDDALAMIAFFAKADSVLQRIAFAVAFLCDLIGAPFPPPVDRKRQAEGVQALKFHGMRTQSAGWSAFGPDS
jgi:hypothetical protein